MKYGVDERGFNSMQGLVDHMNAADQQRRSGGQMTLGKLIALLETLPLNAQVMGLGEALSYRGYYDDLAFEPSETPRTVLDLLGECRRCMGRVFTGYKGGDYLMGEHTPLWISEYGEASGLRLIGLSTETDGPFTPVTREER